jgi:hypothetical protein
MMGMPYHELRDGIRSLRWGLVPLNKLCAIDSGLCSQDRLPKFFGSKRRLDLNNPKPPKRIQHGIASPVAFDEAVHTSFITGAALNVDGGCSAWFRASLSPLVWRFLLVKPDRWDQI